MTKFIKVLFWFIASTVFAIMTGCQSDKSPLSLDEKDNDLQALIDKNNVLEASSVDEALSKARKAWSAGKTDLSLAFYIRAYKMQPKNVEILEEMASVYKKLNNNELVEVCYRLILDEQPNNIPILERYGLLLIQQKKLPEAEQVLKKVVANEQSWEAYNGLGIIADIHGDHKQARMFFGKAVIIHPEHPEILNNIGYSLYMEGQLEKAQGYFLWALKIDKSFKKAIYNYALTLARQKRYAEALSVFAKVMRLSEANNNTGYLAMKNGDYEKADYYLRQAVKLSPHFYQKAQLNLQELDTLRKQGR